MSYILFNNLTSKEVDEVMEFLDTESGNSHFGPVREDALGVCFTECTGMYTFLSKSMCCKDNFYISWVMCRKEYVTVDGFISAVRKQLDVYHQIKDKL